MLSATTTPNPTSKVGFIRVKPSGLGPLPKVPKNETKEYVTPYHPYSITVNWYSKILSKCENIRIPEIKNHI